MFKQGRAFNYANVTATIALVLSMSSGALAADHYIINSTKQISPKVLKELRGHAGSAGATGATGSPGASGATGAPGATGPERATGTAETPGGPTGATGAEGAPGATGAEGATGATGAAGYAGATGAQGEPGATGATGAAGSALAYAHVTEAGDVEEAKNFGKVTQVGDLGGIYCNSELPGGIPHIAEVTPDNEESTGETIDQVSIAPFAPGSPAAEACESVANTEVEVLTLEHNLPEQWGFYIALN